MKSVQSWGLGLVLWASVAMAQQPSSQPVTLDIQAQPIEGALNAFARQAGVQILFYSQITQGIAAPRLVGHYTPQSALTQLLAGTSLRYEFINERTVAIRSPKPIAATAEHNASTPPVAQVDDISVQGGANDGLWGRLLVAQAAQSSNATSVNGVPQSLSEESEKQEPLQEVLVTARKTGVAERLQDVPVPISVVSAQSLMDSNQTKLEDYFDQIPGLVVAQNGPISIVSMRGITTGVNNNPTVGYTLDDVPLGGSLNGAAAQVPAIDPADLAQVEVLRGPQGTLYGDNSMGGLIRYVTVDPSTDHVFGDVRVGSDEVFNGRHLGYSTSGAINLPLTDSLAIRVSAFTRMDPGYIDDIETGERGVNTTKAGGGRIAAKWTLSPDFSIKLTALYEKSYRYGAAGIDVPTSGYPQTLGLHGLQQVYFWQTGGIDQDYKTASLTFNANIAGIKLTAISGYTVSEEHAAQDFTADVVDIIPPSTGAPLYDENRLHKFTQELRLSSAIGSHIEWLLGGFYNQEDDFTSQEINVTEAVTGAVVGLPGSIYYSDGPNRFKEYAGFGSLTWKITDPFDIQFGGRESYLSNPSLAQGGYYGGLFNDAPPGPSTYSPPSPSYWKENAFTYMVSPRFKLSPDAMVYARVANGFRPGGGTSNPQPTDDCVVNHYQCLILPDKVTDYEIGAKADFLDHTLSIDSSLYYIDWKDMQLNLPDAGQVGIFHDGNGSGAKSQGLDLALDWKPLEGLTISTWGAWNRAVLTQPFANGAAGQPLPYSARFSGNCSVEEEVAITSDMHAYFAGKEIYMGNRLGEFTDIDSPRTDLPAYFETNLNAGIRLNPWTFNLYVNNVMDRRGVIYGGLDLTPPFEFVYINPRTVGLSVLRNF